MYGVGLFRPKKKMRHVAATSLPTYHDLRHCYASWLVQRGRTLKEVQELFGHRTVNMTYRYFHPSTANRRQAVAVLDCLRSPRSTWCAWQESNLRIRSSLADLVEGAASSRELDLSLWINAVRGGF